MKFSTAILRLQTDSLRPPAKYRTVHRIYRSILLLAQLALVHPFHRPPRLALHVLSVPVPHLLVHVKGTGKMTFPEGNSKKKMTRGPYKGSFRRLALVFSIVPGVQ